MLYSTKRGDGGLISWSTLGLGPSKSSDISANEIGVWPETGVLYFLSEHSFPQAVPWAFPVLLLSAVSQDVSQPWGHGRLNSAISILQGCSLFQTRLSLWLKLGGCPLSHRKIAPCSLLLHWLICLRNHCLTGACSCSGACEDSGLFLSFRWGWCFPHLCSVTTPLELCLGCSTSAFH